MAKSAAANAKKYNGVGYHYPWESGTSGQDVTPDSCPSSKPNCHSNRLYVTAGVSYAIRMYYSLTRDRDYMVNTIYSGCDVSREVAKFLAGQAIYKPEHGRYDMNGNIVYCYKLTRSVKAMALYISIYQHLQQFLPLCVASNY